MGILIWLQRSIFEQGMQNVEWHLSFHLFQIKVAGAISQPRYQSLMKLQSERQLLIYRQLLIGWQESSPPTLFPVEILLCLRGIKICT